MKHFYLVILLFGISICNAQTLHEPITKTTTINAPVGSFSILGGMSTRFGFVELNIYPLKKIIFGLVYSTSSKKLNKHPNLGSSSDIDRSSSLKGFSIGHHFQAFDSNIYYEVNIAHNRTSVKIQDISEHSSPFSLFGDPRDTWTTTTANVKEHYTTISLRFHHIKNTFDIWWF
ncbi:MAG: hypothetical protein ACI9JN_001708 [Bacteroidia bacterium]|jgi:hypothetical protein